MLLVTIFTMYGVYTHLVGLPGWALHKFFVGIPRPGAWPKYGQLSKWASWPLISQQDYRKGNWFFLFLKGHGHGDNFWWLGLKNGNSYSISWLNTSNGAHPQFLGQPSTRMSSSLHAESTEGFPRCCLPCCFASRERSVRISDELRAHGVQLASFDMKGWLKAR